MEVIEGVIPKIHELAARGDLKTFTLTADNLTTSIINLYNNGSLNGKEATGYLDRTFAPVKDNPSAWMEWWRGVKTQDHLGADKDHIMVALVQARPLGLIGPNGIPSVEPVLELLAEKYGLQEDYRRFIQPEESVFPLPSIPVFSPLQPLATPGEPASHIGSGNTDLPDPHAFLAAPPTNPPRTSASGLITLDQMTPEERAQLDTIMGERSPQARVAPKPAAADAAQAESARAARPPEPTRLAPQTIEITSPTDIFGQLIEILKRPEEVVIVSAHPEILRTYLLSLPLPESVNRVKESAVSIISGKTPRDSIINGQFVVNAKLGPFSKDFTLTPMVSVDNSTGSMTVIDFGNNIPNIKGGAKINHEIDAFKKDPNGVMRRRLNKLIRRTNPDRELRGFGINDDRLLRLEFKRRPIEESLQDAIEDARADQLKPEALITEITHIYLATGLSEKDATNAASAYIRGH